MDCEARSWFDFGLPIFPPLSFCFVRFVFLPFCFCFFFFWRKEEVDPELDDVFFCTI